MNLQERDCPRFRPRQSRASPLLHRHGSSLVENRMQGKVVLITGGAKRVGAATCRRLHAAGASLMIHYRSSAAEAQALCDDFNRQRAGSAALVQGDLHDTARLAELVNAALKQFGRLDVLINNASSFYPTAVGEIDEQEWQDLVGTNLKAPLFLAQAAADALRHSHGCIVNIEIGRAHV